jgi:predicted phage gp36 major capsid-like protein
MEQTIRDDTDPEHRLARYVVDVSDRDYFRAFSKLLNDPVTGMHLWTPEERAAVQRVKTTERSLTLFTSGTAGGFLVPYELDPKILISNAGSISPLREISRVATTAQNEKRFVTSTGVDTHWDPEETETTDDSPTLLQPAILQEGRRVRPGQLRALRGRGHRAADRASSPRSSPPAARRSSRPARTCSRRPTCTPTRPHSRPAGGRTRSG